MTRPLFVDEDDEVYQLRKTDDVVRRLEAAERRLVRNLLQAPWEPTDEQVLAWEELLERAAQVRIRLQQAKRSALGCATRAR